jgi:hypothetical protein
MRTSSRPRLPELGTSSGGGVAFDGFMPAAVERCNECDDADADEDQGKLFQDAHGFGSPRFMTFRMHSEKRS